MHSAPTARFRAAGRPISTLRVASRFSAFWRKSKLARWKLVGLAAPSEALTEWLTP